MNIYNTILRRIFPILFLVYLPATAQNGLHFLKKFDNKHGTTSGVSYSGSWGYVAPDGREYAILGTATGTAIIEITDTGNIHEIAHVSGPTSIWREMRTYKNYLYIVSEGGFGTQIVDLSFLPDGIDHVKNFVYTNGAKNTQRSHTIEIFDGYMYLNGCANWGISTQRGAVIFSLADPINPAYVGEYSPAYFHDSYVRNDTIFGAAINSGGGIYIADIQNKSAPVSIGKISYSGSGTHNLWSTADGKYIISTDEIGATPKTLKFWDLTTLPTLPTSPSATYQFNPTDIEHNVFVRGKYAYTAWYTAGIVVVDVRTPTSPATAGFYDTSTEPGGYDGVWAVYPYFWSGKVIAGDMQNGLYVFSFDSLQARTPTSLAEPAHETVACDSTSLTFRWTRVADQAQDPHKYWLHVYSADFDSTFKAGADTSFTIPNTQILGTGTFSWHVITTDEANYIPSQDTFTFVRPGPIVNAPNGGNVIKVFSQTTISWDWLCTDSLEISYSTNNGMTWTVIQTVPSSLDSFVWNVPAIPTTSARIRLRDVNDSSRVDISDSAFTIFNSASITMTSPNGGELWQGGSVHQITWSSVLVDSLKIEYSTDDGVNWSTIVGDTTASINSYDWTVPDIFTSQGIIRLTDLYNNTVFDQSDAPFFVALMTITLEEDWNLSSIPVTPVYPSASANYPYATSPAFTYEGSYIEADTVTNGIGYWVKYGSAQTIAALGSLVTSDTIPLAARWNMIGSISAPVAVSSMTASPDSIILSNFFEYSSDSAYTIADSIKSGKGYWVKASVAGELHLLSSMASPSTRINIVPTSEMPPLPPNGRTPSTKHKTPERFALEQNYPNPFNPTTDIRFQITEIGFVTLKIYDVLGREVATLLNEEKRTGYYVVQWDASQVPSGMYYAHMIVTDASGRRAYLGTKKLVLMK